MYGTLSFYEFRLSGEDTMEKNLFDLLALTDGADAKTASTCAWVPKNFHNISLFYKSSLVNFHKKIFVHVLHDPI